MNIATQRTLFCLLLLVCQSSCSSRQSGQPDAINAAGNRPLRVAFNTWIGYSSFYIAEEKGIFAKHGVDVDTRIIDSLAEKNAAIIRGEIDAMGGTMDSAVISAASGAGGKIVHLFDRSHGADGIIVADTITRVTDLKESRIAVEEGFVGHYFLLYVLQQHNIDAGDVSILPMTTDQAGAAFVAGQVDAAVTWEPYLSTAKQRADARLLVSTTDYPIILDVLYVSESALAGRRDAVTRLVVALKEANEYWISHMSESNEIVARRWQMDLEEVEAIMSGVELFDEMLTAEYVRGASQSKLSDYLVAASELWYSAGVTERRLPARHIIDPALQDTP